MRVIISTTKGKNDRIEFAATENAKVWTSVRRRYFTVETTRFGGRFRGDAGFGGIAKGVGDVGIEGVGTGE
jgi:hypothetical protein